MILTRFWERVIHHFISNILGAYGQVFKCIHRQSRSVRAVKTLLKSGFYNDDERERFISEVTLLKNMDHPNILKLYEVF